MPALLHTPDPRDALVYRIRARYFREAAERVEGDKLKRDYTILAETYAELALSAEQEAAS